MYMHPQKTCFPLPPDFPTIQLHMPFLRAYIARVRMHELGSLYARKRALYARKRAPVCPQKSPVCPQKSFFADAPDLSAGKYGF